MVNSTLIQNEFATKEGKLVYYTNDIAINKETILMLHPAFADHKIFIEQIKAFDLQYNLVLIDQPGHGKSNTKGSSLNVSMLPKLIYNILKEISIEKVHILGVSLGSLIGQGFADQFPDMIHSVTVVGGYSIHMDNQEILKAQRKETMKWAFLILFNMKKFREYVVDVSVNSVEGKKMMREGVMKFTRRSFRNMSGMNQLFRKTDEIKLYPLLALVGEHDLDIAKSSAVKLGNLINGQYSMIMNAAHCANIDNPTEFNARFLAFLETNLHTNK